MNFFPIKNKTSNSGYDSWVRFIKLKNKGVKMEYQVLNPK
jgi:hypothetical protein